MPIKSNKKPKIVNDTARNKSLEDYRYHQKIACLSEVLKGSHVDNEEVAKRLAIAVNAAFDTITL